MNDLAHIESRDAAGRRKRHVREVMSLAWPAILHGLVITVVFFTDRLILGRYSPDALAATSVGGPVGWSLFSIAGFFGPALVAVVGRLIGAKRVPEARATVASMMLPVALFGIGLAAVGWLSQYWIVDLMLSDEATSAHVTELAERYMGIMMLASPAVLGGMLVKTTFQAVGDTRTPMWIGGATGALNLLLSWILVFGHFGAPELGVVGAAIGSVAAFSAEALVAGLLLTRSSLYQSERGAQSHRSELWRLGWSTFQERTIYHMAYLVFVGYVGHLGDVVMAAHQTVIAIEAIAFITADGYAIAASTLIAQRLGADEPDEAKALGWMTIGLATASLLLVSVTFLTVPSALIRIFTPDAEVVRVGSMALMVAAFAQPFMAITSTASGALRGAGDTRSPMWAAMLGPGIVRLAACYYLAFGLELGLVGIWMGSTLDWLFRAIFLVWVLRRSTWRGGAEA